MSISGKNRKRSNSSQQRTVILLSGGLLALAGIVIGAVYYASPFSATDTAVARLAGKTLAETASEVELQAISSNLYAALDQVIPGGQSDQPESVIARVGKAVAQEVRGQLLTEATRRLASRDGINLALYGWQNISDRRVTVQRDYLEFPDLFSVVMVDAVDGTTLTELVFLRSGFGDWTLVAVRPHWMRNQGPVILRQIVQAGVQKVMQPGEPVAKP